MIAIILRTALHLLFYLAVFPVLAMLSGNLANGLLTGSPEAFDFLPAILAPENLALSYQLGLWPALFAGVIALLLDRSLDGWRRWLCIGFGAASVTAALAWIVFATAPIADGIDPFLFLGVVALAGGLAGIACAALFDLLRGLVRRG